METPSWDDYFMTMVYLVASKSKDKNTHIGAVVVGPKNEVRSVGYNGFVRGLKDDVPERQQRPEKYFWFEHAERNAIYNATLMGVSLENCKMYTNGVPCMDCARGVVQSGIREVIVDYEWDKDNSDKWRENAERTSQMFQEVGVGVRYYNGYFMKIAKFKNGIEVPLL
jgi:dCMP deaminase